MCGLRPIFGPTRYKWIGNGGAEAPGTGLLLAVPEMLTSFWAATESSWCADIDVLQLCFWKHLFMGHDTSSPR